VILWDFIEGKKASF